jgi:hypothetical protein
MLTASLRDMLAVQWWQREWAMQAGYLRRRGMFAKNGADRGRACTRQRMRADEIAKGEVKGNHGAHALLCDAEAEEKRMGGDRSISGAASNISCVDGRDATRCSGLLGRQTAWLVRRAACYSSVWRQRSGISSAAR